MRCMLASRWRRLALYVLFQKRLIFSLLFLNLVFFIGMYFMASSDDAFGKAAPDVFNPEVDVLDIDPINDHSRYADKDPNGVIDHYQKNCSQLKRPHPNLTEAFRWHKVASKTFVYSAYFDNRTSMDFVLIWGISAGSAGVKGERSKRYCQVWYHNRILPVILWAVYEIIPETHGLRYAPAMFICPVIRHDPPYAVSLVTSKCARPSHVLPVHGPSHLKPRATFTVCVSPLNKHYDDIHSLVEFIEMNLILGADKIVFYNHTTGPRLDRYLSHYVSIGVVDVIPWKIPVAVDPDPPDPRIAPEIHYFGQVVALNECLYRYMYSSRYLVYTDLDEIIVPRSHDSWRGMMKHLDRLRTGSTRSRGTRGAFLFRNAFFRIDWPDEGADRSADEQLRLKTLLKLRREDEIWPFYQRTKYILVPKAVLQIGIHYVFEFVHSGINHKEVPADVALLHHYREWSGNNSSTLGVVDKEMLRFADPLRQSVRAVHRTLGLVDIKGRTPRWHVHLV